MKLNNLQFNKFIGKKISKIRIKLGISQEELAKKLGFSRIALSTYESGRSKFTVYQLMLTAEILGVDFNEFLPKNTSKEEIETKIKRKIEEVKIKEDTEFMLELSIRSYLLSRGVKKIDLSKKTEEILKLIEL